MTSLKKSIAALALSLPLAASAQQAAPAAAAPAPLYQIYGTLNLNTQYIEVSGAEQPGGRNMSGRLAVSTDSTNVGIRGTADLGQGLGVVYQCETTANLDGESPTGLCNRNSRIGLSTGFGTVFYGNWDTPYKALLYGTKADDPFGNTDVFDAAAIIGSPGLKTRSSGARSMGATTPNTLLSFNQRAGNSIAYHSPKFGPVQVKAQYSVNEFQNRRGDIAPALYSAGLNFDLGTISGGVAYERHSDYARLAVGGTPAAPTVTAAVPDRTTTDQGVKAGAGIELPTGFGATSIGAQVEWLQHGIDNAVAGELDSFSRIAYMIALKHRMGNHEFRVRFSQALEADAKVKGGSSDTVDDSGATNYAVGYAYYLSKAAQIYLSASLLDNAKNATYTFATAGPAQLTATNSATAPDVEWTRGADPLAVGLGMRYAF